MRIGENTNMGMYNGFSVIKNPNMTKIEKRTLKEFFFLKPRFKFKKTVPDTDSVLTYGRTIIAHPIVVDQIIKAMGKVTDV